MYLSRKFCVQSNSWLRKENFDRKPIHFERSRPYRSSNNRNVSQGKNARHKLVRMRRWLIWRSFTLVYATSCETKRRIRRKSTIVDQYSSFHVYIKLQLETQREKVFRVTYRVNVFRALSFDRSVPKTIQLWCTVRVIKTAFTVSPRFFSFFFFFFLITLKLDFSGKGSSNAILAQTLGIKVILTSTVQFRGYIKLRLYRFLHILSLLFVFASRNNV